jgi:hypothetical protein
VLVHVGELVGHVKIAANLNVETRFYRGPLQISFAGFRDEQNGSIITKELTTGFVEPALIGRGEAPGWAEITEVRNHIIDRIEDPDSKQVTKPSIGGVPLHAMMVMGVVEGLPETIEEYTEVREEQGRDASF